MEYPKIPKGEPKGAKPYLLQLVRQRNIANWKYQIYENDYHKMVFSLSDPGFHVPSWLRSVLRFTAPTRNRCLVCSVHAHENRTRPTTAYTCDEVRSYAVGAVGLRVEFLDTARSTSSTPRPPPRPRPRRTRRRPPRSPSRGPQGPRGPRRTRPPPCPRRRTSGRRHAWRT